MVDTLSPLDTATALIPERLADHQPAPPARRGFGKSLRLRQIRLTARVFVRLDRFPVWRRLTGTALRSGPARSVLKNLFGYKWVFHSLTEAKESAFRYLESSHEHPDNALLHLSLAETARQSDYPVLFHLAQIIPTCRKVFDLGGNVGNLLYCYSKYLEFPPDLEWTVCDVPQIAEIGRSLARKRNETRLKFDGNTDRLSEADLLLVSGSLHYFELSLPEMLTASGAKPNHLIINRTPLTTGPETVTVQDAGSFLVACKLYSKDELLRQFDKLDYDLIDSWDVSELSVHIPCFPEMSVPMYSGLYFKRRNCE